MTIARNGQFEVLDYTSLVPLIERTDNALEAMGLFESFFGQTLTAEVERVTLGSDTILAKSRAGDRNYADQETAQLEFFRIPFFPLDKMAKASDVQDFREYSTANTPATVERRVERNLTRIGKSHDFLRREAMYTCLKGTTFAPGLASSQYVKVFKDVWDVASDVVVTSIDFTVSTSDPALKLEKVGREHIIAQAQDDAGAYSVSVLCGSGFFNSIVNHPLVQAAYDQYASSQEPLRQRLGGDIVGRVFEHKGISYVEDISGQIARDDAYMFPMGIQDMFQIHYAPANTLEHANTVAESMYIFLEQDRRAATVQTETSFVCINQRPELVIEISSNTLLPDA